LGVLFVGGTGYPDPRTRVAHLMHTTFSSGP
jgi:hypothetical protein